MNFRITLCVDVPFILPMIFFSGASLKLLQRGCMGSPSRSRPGPFHWNSGATVKTLPPAYAPGSQWKTPYHFLFLPLSACSSFPPWSPFICSPIHTPKPSCNLWPQLPSLPRVHRVIASVRLETIFRIIKSNCWSSPPRPLSHTSEFLLYTSLSSHPPCWRSISVFSNSALASNSRMHLGDGFYQ